MDIVRSGDVKYMELSGLAMRKLSSLCRHHNEGDKGRIVTFNLFHSTPRIDENELAFALWPLKYS